MNSIRYSALFLFLIGLGCSPESSRKSQGPVASKPGTAAPGLSVDESQFTEPQKVLLRILRDKECTGVLYTRMEKIEGPDWITAKGRSRPGQGTPHWPISREELDAAISALMKAQYFEKKEGDLLGHSYLLELVAKGVPKARLDMHTEGGASPSLFLIDHEKKELKKEGYVNLPLSKEGSEAWRRYFDALVAGKKK